MKQSRVKKTAYNIITLLAYEIINFACELIIPRLILQTYGSEYNGLVSSITQFLTFVSILRLGVAGSTRVELYKSLAKNDTQKTSEILVATEKYMKKIAIFFIGYLLILSIIYPIFTQTSNIQYLEILSLVLIIGIGTFAKYFFGITYQTLLQADQKLYIYNIIQSVAIIINTLIASALILQGQSIQLTNFVSSIIFTLSPIALNIIVTKKYNLNKKAKPDTKALDKKNDAAATSIANIIHDNTDLIVLTLISGVKVVSVYTVYNLIRKILQQSLSVFTSSLESIFGEIWVKKDFKKLEERLENYEFFISNFISVIYPTAFILIIPFISIYTRGITDIEYINYPYAILVLIAQIIMSLRTPYLTVVQAAGKYKETKKGAYTEAIINITLSVILTIQFGIIGVVIGTLAANLFRTLQYYIYIDKNIIKRPKFNLIKNISIITINISSSIAITNTLADPSNIHNYIEWIKMAIISVTISLIITMATSLLFNRKQLIAYKTIIFRKKT